MAQNVYDRDDFFENYSQLPRSQLGLEGALEWPDLRMMVGSVANLRVLDLGCGYGWFCRWARARGAKSVQGVDISEKMIAKAREMGAQGIEYSIGNLDVLELPAEAYDLVYSSLAFHYLTDIIRLFHEVYKSLTPGGSLVFSVEHPIFTAPTQEAPSFEDRSDAVGHRSWPLNSYAKEGLRVRNWLADSVQKQHWKIDSYVSAILDAGLVLIGMREWMPSLEYVEKHPEWKNERERPLFLLISATKRN